MRLIHYGLRIFCISAECWRNNTLSSLHLTYGLWIITLVPSHQGASPVNIKRATEQFNITIPPAMAKRIRDSIEAGAYASHSDVFRDALRRMWDKSEATQGAAAVPAERQP
jgi:hypothetical protein